MKKTFLLTSLLVYSCLPGFSQENAPISEKPNDRVNFPSNYQVDAGADVILFGDYLFWIAHEDGLYYAQTGAGPLDIGPLAAQIGDDDPAAGTDFDGHLKKVETKWDNGVRAGLGINFPKEGYDFLLYWTWIATEAHDSVDSPDGTILTLWSRPDFATGGTFAKGKWDLNLNVGDFEWGRSSWFGGHFSLRPFFGIRGLWLDQSLKNRYAYDTTPVVLGNLHLNSDFRGGGLRTGADGRFAMPYGFSIYGLASGSLLYGRFNADMRFKEDQFTIGYSKDHFWKGISSLQLALGLSWDSHFMQDHCHIELHIGWEQNIWFNVNQMNHFLNQLNNGSYFKENSNLTLQGLVVGGRFDF